MVCIGLYTLFVYSIFLVTKLLEIKESGLIFDFLMDCYLFLLASFHFLKLGVLDTSVLSSISLCYIFFQIVHNFFLSFLYHPLWSACHNESKKEMNK